MLLHDRILLEQAIPFVLNRLLFDLLLRLKSLAVVWVHGMQLVLCWHALVGDADPMKGECIILLGIAHWQGASRVQCLRVAL